MEIIEEISSPKVPGPEVKLFWWKKAKIRCCLRGHVSSRVINVVWGFRVQLLDSYSPLCFQSQKDPMLVEKIMNDLDTNKDNEVDFNEFVVLVAALTVACNDFFQEQQKKTK